MTIQAKLLQSGMLLAVIGHASGSDRLVSGFPELPIDAREVAERFVACVHFSGEITGSYAERDAEVNQAMRELKCSSVEKDLERMRAKYGKNAAVLKVLREVDP
jgi:hypothetical protein